MNLPPLLAQVTNTPATNNVATNATTGAATSGEPGAEQAAEAAKAVIEAAEPGWLSEMLHSGALGLLLEGGFFMWPILLMGIIALGVIIERWRSLKMLSTDSSELREKVLDMLTHDEVEQALEKCDAERGPVPAILSNGLRKYLVLRKLNYDPAKIEEQVLKSMENYGVHVVAALERHLPILAIVSSVAPMMGFLGTVQGMIVAFGDIVEQMGEVNIVEAAASGIQVALLTTCFGLIIGIPAFMAFNYFSSVINGFVLQVEESAADLIEVVTLQVTLEQGDAGEA